MPTMSPRLFIAAVTVNDRDVTRRTAHEAVHSPADLAPSDDHSVGVDAQWRGVCRARDIEKGERAEIGAPNPDRQT